MGRVGALAYGKGARTCCGVSGLVSPGSDEISLAVAFSLAGHAASTSLFVSRKTHPATSESSGLNGARSRRSLLFDDQLKGVTIIYADQRKKSASGGTKSQLVRFHFLERGALIPLFVYVTATDFCCTLLQL